MFDHFWLDIVVGIYKGDVFAGGFLDTAVSGGGEALVLLGDDFNT